MDNTYIQLIRIVCMYQQLKNKEEFLQGHQQSIDELVTDLTQQLQDEKKFWALIDEITEEKLQ